MPLNPTLAQGIDIYSGNGAYTPRKPVDFVIAKSSEGTALDTRFDQNYDTCAKAGIPFFAYHYMRTSVAWRYQADVMLGAIAGKKVSMLFWDYETKHNVLNPKSAADAVSAMSYLRQMTGKPVGLYADRQRTADIYRDAPASRDFPLYFAQYYISKKEWDNTPNIEPKYTPQFKQQVPWFIWQYASELNFLGHDAGHEYGVESHSIDINVCKFSKEELVGYLSLFSGNSNIFNATPDPQLSLQEQIDDLDRRVKKLEGR